MSKSTPQPLTNTRTQLSERQARTVDGLCAASVRLLREVGYDGLTVRKVASEAGVSSATAYLYFSSKDHLVTEIFWRRLAGLAETHFSSKHGPLHRLDETLTDIALLVADEPNLASACSIAMLGTDPDVKVLRDRIGAEMHRRIGAALGEGQDLDPSIGRTFDLVISGALVHAGMGHLRYEDLPARLAEAGRVILGSSR